MKKKISLLSITFACIIFSVNAQWVQTNLPFNGSINCITTLGSTIFAGTEGDGVYLSVDSGSTWTPVNSGLQTSFVYSFAVNGSNLFAGTSAGIFLTTDTGSNWYLKNNGLPTLSIFSLFYSGTTIFAGTYNDGLFFSTDTGSNWIQANNGFGNNSIRALAVDGSYIYAGIYGGMYLSTDTGSTWTTINNGFLAYPDVSALAMHGTDIYAGTMNGGVFFSTDSGSHWIQMNNGLTDMDTVVYSLKIDGDNILIGTQGGVFMSNCGSKSSWTSLNESFTLTNIISVEISDSTLYAGNDLGEFFTRNFTDITEVEKTKDFNSNFIIYPNPFISSFTIEVNSEIKNAKLRVYDILGNNVMNVNNISNQKISINRGNIENGLYFYQLTQENKIVASGKLIAK